MDEVKQKIIDLFYKNVKGNRSDTRSSNTKHDGTEGHWLERQMGVAPNADNKPDLFGYEMKNHTSSGKISYGDWSANEYIFHGKSNKRNNTNKDFNISRDAFFDFFGKPNLAKNNRPSWSGEPCPTYFHQTTKFGQTLNLDKDNNIIITYSYSLDERKNKASIMPSQLQKDELVIAKWNRQSLKNKIERKFNQRGWFTCRKDNNGTYEEISFGPPMDFNTWLSLFKNKKVYFDSAMYKGNNRPYSMWRSNTSFWDSLIIDTY